MTALTVLGNEYRAARIEAEATRLALHEGIRVAVAAGLNEVKAAQEAGVTRMTVRAALGKR